MIDQREYLKRRLDGILRAYVRQPHKRVSFASIRKAIEVALRDGLVTDEIRNLLMLVEPTDDVQSKRRFDEIHNFLHSRPNSS